MSSSPVVSTGRVAAVAAVVAAVRVATVVATVTTPPTGEPLFSRHIGDSSSVLFLSRREKGAESDEEENGNSDLRNKDRVAQNLPNAANPDGTLNMVRRRYEQEGFPPTN